MASMTPVMRIVQIAESLRSCHSTRRSYEARGWLAGARLHLSLSRFSSRAPAEANLSPEANPDALNVRRNCQPREPPLTLRQPHLALRQAGVGKEHGTGFGRYIA